MTYGCKIMVSLTLCGFFWTTLYSNNHVYSVIPQFRPHSKKNNRKIKIT